MGRGLSFGAYPLPRARLRFAELDDGRLQNLIRSLSIHARSCEKARQCAEYIERNRHRMDYPRFHEQGLFTSSGVVEAGCKVAVGSRLKRAGMHWTTHGANAILALRCSRLSGRFENFFERRAPVTA